jgi:hypothetical protein
MSPPIPAAEPPNPSTKVSAWRRPVRIIGGLFGSLIALLIIWMGAQVLLRRPYPTMMFTQADMPNLPPIADNGWEILKNELGPNIQVPRPDKDIASLSDPKATFTDRWTRATANATKLAAVAGDEQNRKWIAVIDKAAALPYFADGCPIALEPQCPRPVQLLNLHQMQEAVVLHEALTGHWDEAFARTIQMMRTDDLFLPSARSTLDQAVARSILHRTVKLVDIVLDGAAEEKKEGRGPGAAQLAEFARKIDPLVTRIREDDLSPMKTVVAEYLYSVQILEHLHYFPQSRSRYLREVFYDPGHTLEMLNERFEKYVAFAKANAAGPVPEFPRKWNWFLRNPIGHLALEPTRGAIENRVPAIVKDRTVFLKDQDALHKRLEAIAKGN